MTRPAIKADHPNVTNVDITPLRSELIGGIIEPGDGDYEEAKTVFYGGEVRRPAAIARVAHADDVARVVTFARESGIDLAVRGGGHSVARHSLVEGGVVLDLRDMKAIEIDAEERTAWAETGSRRVSTQPLPVRTVSPPASETPDRWGSGGSRSGVGSDISCVSTA
jgi:hypothetical protein